MNPWKKNKMKWHLENPPQINNWMKLSLISLGKELMAKLHPIQHFLPIIIVANYVAQKNMWPQHALNWLTQGQNVPSVAMGTRLIIVVWNVFFIWFRSYERLVLEEDRKRTCCHHKFSWSFSYWWRGNSIIIKSNLWSWPTCVFWSSNAKKEIAYAYQSCRRPRRGDCRWKTQGANYVGRSNSKI